MSELATLEIFLRGGAVSALLTCVILFAPGVLGNRKNASVAALCLSLCAYVIISSPGLEPRQGSALHVLVAVAAAVPVLVYWAALELFQDEVHPRPWQLLVAMGIVLSAWLSQVGMSLDALRALLVMILFVHLFAVILSGADGDLIEARRKFRTWFLASVATFGVIITVMELTGADRALPLWMFALHGLAFWLLAGAFIIWAVRIDAGIWVASPAQAAPQSGLSPAQKALVSRIEHAMQEGLWQQEGLTVAQLARHLDTQEHRLRQTINQGLGCRNFSNFINGFRITRAQAMLRDPALAERTVLSIAYDVGFASLGPFNRAFRAQTGMTPTEYRKAELI
ncbi:MAG: AraC family transcriptional regulator [Pseudomonadota bacterium]